MSRWVAIGEWIMSDGKRIQKEPCLVDAETASAAAVRYVLTCKNEAQFVVVAEVSAGTIVRRFRMVQPPAPPPPPPFADEVDWRGDRR